VAEGLVRRGMHCPKLETTNVSSFMYCRPLAAAATTTADKYNV